MMRNVKHYLLLFSFCQVIRGKQRSVICDFQHKQLKFIPHTLQAVIYMLKKQSFEQVQNTFSGEERTIFDSYVDFLLKHNFAFFTPHPERFPDILPIWMSPEEINNAVLEYDFSSYNMLDVLQQIDRLQGKFIEFRFVTFDKENVPILQKILQFCQHSMLRSVRMYFPSTIETQTKLLIQLIANYSIVETLVFYQQEQRVHQKTDRQNICYITESLNTINSASISLNHLVNDMQYFYESHHFNPYYNKKVSVDRLGNIKNCIKNRGVFGNVNNDKLKKVVQTSSFREFWHVHHDKIVDIADSELRYHRIITHDLNKLTDGNYQLIY